MCHSIDFKTIPVDRFFWKTLVCSFGQFGFSVTPTIGILFPNFADDDDKTIKPQMLGFKSLHPYLPLGTIICYAMLSTVFKNAASTEVTESIWLVDESLGFEINLPVLMCHAKYSEYHEVRWYKDYILLKQGPAALSDHILSLLELLENPSYVQFEHPLKLQGYYWCETDHLNTSVVHRYLFQIQEIKTYVGKFLSTQDSLGDDHELSLNEKVTIKKKIYEEEMQEVLFGFLPRPNTFVTDITEQKEGLEVNFYLYVRQLLHPRQPNPSELVEDQHEHQYVIEYLNNEAISVDPDLYQQIIDWTNFRGINTTEIKLLSTLGCYQEVSQVTVQPAQDVTWPFAAIGEVVIPDESCSSKNGLAVTRLCTGSFYAGARWGNPSGNCNMPPSKLTLKIKDLYNKFGDKLKPDYIQKLQELTKDTQKLTVTDLHIVTDILTELSEVKELKSTEVEDMFYVVDRIIETNRSELISAKSTLQLTTRLLQVFNNVLRLPSLRNHDVSISKQHLLLDTKNSKLEDEDHVIGIAILSAENGSVEFIRSGSSIPKHDSSAYFLLPQDLVIRREVKLKFHCKVNVVYFKNWLLFPNPKDVLLKRNYKVLPSPVMYVSLSGGPAWNLTSPVQLFFKNMYKRKIEDPTCVQFDPRLENGEGSWSTEGCQYGGLKDGFFICRCQHLSIFAVILSERPDSDGKIFRLGTAIYVGCTVSIIALCFTVLLYLLSKSWRSTMDQKILFWLALSLLCCLVILLISEMHFRWKPGCLLMAMSLTYVILVITGWLLVQAVVHRLRFANKTDIEEVPHFILKSALSAWGVPFVIMIIIWISNDYKYHNQETCLMTVSDMSRAALVPTVTVLLVALCVNVCAVYAVTCRFKKDYVVENSNCNESVLKFRIALAIYFFFVMSWLFGFFALNDDSKELRILFSISITLTSYYVTLFFVFYEVSFWQLCRRWRRGNASNSEVVKFVAEKKAPEPQTPNDQN